MRWTIGKKIGAAFAVAPLILAAVGVITYQNTTRLLSAAEKRGRSYDALINLERVFSILKDNQSGMRGFVITGEERYLKPYNSSLTEADKVLKALRQLTSENAGQQRLLDGLERQVVSELETTIRYVDTRRVRGFDAAIAQVRLGKGDDAMSEVGKTITEMEAKEKESLQRYIEAVRTNSERTISVILVLTLMSVAFLSGFGLVTTRMIANPIREITSAAERVASGDLTVGNAAKGGADELGVLSRAFAAMVANLRELSRQIKEAANVLASSSSEILAATTQVAAGASEAATAVSQTTVTVEEVKQTAQVSSQKARHVSESAQRAADVSRSGKKAVEQAIGGMSEIRKQMDFIAQSITELSEQTQAIGEVIGTVNDLAEQSNLLAVNAAIEAAKAGEQGKGFAVVAQEIKALAEQSKQGTAQVRSILSEIQKATGRAVMAAEQGSKAVETGVRQTAESGASIGALAENVLEAAQAATLIATSSQQQLVGVDQVATAMESIKQASAQNVASTKQVETAAQNLNKLGQTLKDLVAQMRV